jgi:hypothetical protein
MTGPWLITGAAVILLWLVSLLANRHFSDFPELPMQFGFDGKPTWTAPRVAALCFTPSLATAILPMLTLTTGGSTTRTGPIAMIVAGSFLVVHALHLMLIGRSFRR